MMKKLGKYLIVALAAAFAAACGRNLDPSVETGEEGMSYVRVSLSIGDPAASKAMPDIDSPTPSLSGIAYENAIKTARLYFFLTPGDVPSSDAAHYHDDFGVFERVVTIENYESSSKKIALLPGNYHVYCLVNCTPQDAFGAEMRFETGITSEADFVRNCHFRSDVFLSPAVVEANGMPMASRGYRNINGYMGGGEYDDTAAGWTATNPNPAPEAHANTDMYPREHLYLTGEHTAEHPASLRFKLERMLAKVEVKPVQTSYPLYVESNQVADVVIRRASLRNTRNNAFAFRHARLRYEPDYVFYDRLQPTCYMVVPESGYEYMNGIVDDPHTYEKTYHFPGFVPEGSSVAYIDLHPDYLNWYHRSTIHDPADTEWVNLSTTGTTILGYCFDNTCGHFAQYHGYSTGVILEGEIQPHDAVKYKSEEWTGEEDHFYYRAGWFFRSLADLQEESHLGLPLALNDVVMNDPDLRTQLHYDLLASRDITRFEHGKCYYYLWMRHTDNHGTAVMGSMEFATVRNNVYSVGVNGVSAAGSGDSGPEGLIVESQLLPDRSPKTTIDAEVRLAPWMEYNSNIFFE